MEVWEKMSRRGRIARGLDIGRAAMKMKEKATLAETAGKTWEREFEKGTTNWAYWMRLIMPYLYRAISPEMTPEQRQVAAKEYLRRVKTGLPLFLTQCATAANEYAMKVIPVRAASPLVVHSPELIV